MLKLTQVNAYYGKSHILQGVSLEVERGELVTLLGRNGAGKTTTLKSIMGLVPYCSGSIQYKGQNILEKKTYEIFRQGLGYVPQGRRIFSSLSVSENLRLSSIKQDKGKTEWVLDIFPALRKRLDNRGNQLSGGEQQMLAIGRVLVSGPELILLDEPSEGLAPRLVGSIMDTVKELKKTNLTMLLVEANLTMAATVGDRHYVMAHGVIACEASSQQCLEDEELHQKYFKL
jgi:branched-chain amino acid transport system ATP-binding protein